MPEVLSRPRAVLKTEGTVFPYTDRPRPVNNVFIFSCNFGGGTRRIDLRTICNYKITEILRAFLLVENLLTIIPVNS